MARLKISLPGSEKLIFTTILTVRINDINYGGHLGNDSVLTLCHEARCRFLKSLKCSESDVFGAGIIMADSMAIYKAESFLGDNLTVDLYCGEWSAVGFELFYHFMRKSDSVEIAQVKTGILFFDYGRRKILKVPLAFKERLTYHLHS